MYQPDWKTYLRLVSSHKDVNMPPASQEAFMRTFIVCDPNNSRGSSPPAIVGENDPDRENYAKAMTKAFKCLGFPGRGAGKASKVVLPWLLEEYRNPTNRWWGETVENEITKFQRRGSLESNIVKLDGCLNKLNYTSQRRMVENEAQDVDLAKIFLVPASGMLAQKWFAKRLSFEVQNHTISQGFGIPANAKWNQNSNKFWMSLSEYVNTDESEEIIQILADYCEKAPLIMAIYDAQELEPDMLNYLVDFFWKPLVERVRQQSLAGERGDCILFLTVDSRTNCNINIQDAVRLDPWDKIGVTDLNVWLKDQDIKQFLTDCDGQKSNLMPENGEPSGELEAMLRRICKVFDVGNLSALENCWRLG